MVSLLSSCMDCFVYDKSCLSQNTKADSMLGTLGSTPQQRPTPLLYPQTLFDDASRAGVHLGEARWVGLLLPILLLGLSPRAQAVDETLHG